MSTESEPRSLIETEILAPSEGRESVQKSAEQLPGYKEYQLEQNRIDKAKLADLHEPARDIVVGEAFVTCNGKPVPVDVVYEEYGNQFSYAVHRQDDKYLIGTLDGIFLPAPDPDSKKYFLKEYPGFSEAEQWPKVYIDTMKNKSQGTYTGVGALLHKLGVEHSFKVGAAGRVQSKAAAIIDGMHGPTIHDRITSAGFHEQFGFNFHDVKNEQGEIVKFGSTTHEKLAEGRYNNMQHARNVTAHMPESPAKENLRGELYKSSNVDFPIDETLPMYLPKHIIDREWQSVTEHPVTNISLATARALLRKNHSLKEIERLRSKLVEDSSYDYITAANMARAYVQVGDIASAKSMYEKAIQSYTRYLDTDMSKWEVEERLGYDELQKELSDLDKLE